MQLIYLCVVLFSMVSWCSGALERMLLEKIYVDKYGNPLSEDERKIMELEKPSVLSSKTYGDSLNEYERKIMDWSVALFDDSQCSLDGVVWTLLYESANALEADKLQIPIESGIYDFSALKASEKTSFLVTLIKQQAISEELQKKLLRIIQELVPEHDRYCSQRRLLRSKCLEEGSWKHKDPIIDVSKSDDEIMKDVASDGPLMAKLPQVGYFLQKHIRLNIIPEFQEATPSKKRNDEVDLIVFSNARNSAITNSNNSIDVFRANSNSNKMDADTSIFEDF